MNTSTVMDRLGECLGYMGILNALGQVEKKDATVKKFLNRLLGLPAAMQHLFYAYYTAVLDCLVNVARADGSYDDGVADIVGQSVRLAATRTLFTAPDGVATLHHTVQVDRGVSFAQTQAYLSSVEHDPHHIAGFYIARHELFGRRLVVCAVPRKDAPGLAAVYRPNTGRAPRDMPRSDLVAKYTCADPEAVQPMWEAMVRTNTSPPARACHAHHHTNHRTVCGGHQPVHARGRVQVPPGAAAADVSDCKRGPAAAVGDN